ncbi:MAG: hypothetical protein H7Y36_10675 [Armatimonadetes bacterium]|nr:hypothetical protein [Akkermansiaceae bacterium]
MKNCTKYSIIALPILLSAAALTSCDVDKVKDGEMPEVKVEGEAKLPEYDVDGPEVKVGKKKVEVEVPTVDIQAPKDEKNEDD